MATREQRAKALSLSKRKKAKKEKEAHNLLKLVQGAVEKVEVRHGADGKEGSQGFTGATGASGAEGKAGKDGVTTVIHKTELPPDTFMTKEEYEERIKKLERATMQGPSSPYVSIKEPIHYFSITDASYRIGKNTIKPGINIFGVNFAGNVEVFLPPPKKGHIIYINDESASAATNNITITPP